MRVWILIEDRTFEQEVLGVYSCEELVELAKQDYERQLAVANGSWICGSHVFSYSMELDELPVF
jgi:hypothetical protein